MTGKYWNCSRTEPKRYHYLGATGYALYHVRCKDAATIIDVGCSTGVALLECKGYIDQQGTFIRAIGIDNSKEVASTAKENLDEFIPRDVLDVNAHKGDADVVMCLNVIRFVEWDVRSKIIKKCAKFLNEKGMLITGVDKEHRKKIELEQSSCTVPDHVYGKSLESRLRVWFKLDPTDTRMMRRTEALKYADMLMNEWQDMHRLRKCYIKKTIFVLQSIYTLWKKIMMRFATEI